MANTTRIVIRFDYLPGHSEDGRIGIALYAARYYVGYLAAEDGLPIQEHVVWSGRVKPLMDGRLSRNTWIKWKVIAHTLQEHINTIPRVQLEDMLVTGKIDTLHEIAERIVAETRRREALAKKGCIYSRGGWRVVHPLPTVWAVSAPDYIGVVTAIVDAGSEIIMVDAAPLAGDSKKFKATGLREGIVKGLGRLYRKAGRLVDVIEIDKMLDTAGVKDELAGILDTKVHKYLSNVIVTLTDAAHNGGIDAIHAAMRQLIHEAKLRAEDAGT